MDTTHTIGSVVLVGLAYVGLASAAPAPGSLRQRGAALRHVPAAETQSDPRPEPETPDELTLQASKGPGAQDVTLTWTGASAPYHVYRSGTPGDAGNVEHRLGQTLTQVWVDVAPSGSALFYLVTHPACPSVINDGGFEAGISGGVWTESSTNFGTPICGSFSCGPIFSARTGIYWSWFGGILGPETASVSQSVVIPPGLATLSFWLEIPSCDDFFGLDRFKIFMDGTTLFSANNNDPTCGTRGYRQIVLDVSAFANGASHLVLFQSQTNSFTYPTNFMVDDVRLDVCP